MPLKSQSQQIFFFLSTLLFILVLSSCHSTSSEPEITQIIGTWKDSIQQAEAPQGLLGKLNTSPIVEIIDIANIRFTFLGISEVCKPVIDEDKNTIYLMWNNQQVELTYFDTGEPNLSLTMKGKQIDLLRTSLSAKPAPFESNFSDAPILTEAQLLGKWQIILHTGGEIGETTAFMKKYRNAVYDFKLDNRFSFTYQNNDDEAVLEEGNYNIQGKNQINFLFKNKISLYNCPMFYENTMRWSKEDNSVLTLKKVGIVEEEKKITRPQDAIVAAAKEKLNFDSFNENQKFGVKNYEAYRKEIIDNYNVYCRIIDSRSNKTAFQKIKADFKLIKENESLADFIAKSKYIEPGVENEYFRGLEMILTGIREDVK